MPIQPIDLQTLFMRLNQVGKDQAAQKEATHIAQTLRGSEIARRAEEQVHTVNESRDLEYGPNAVKDDEQKNKNENRGEENNEPSIEQSEDEKKEVFKDPDLGNKLDITG